MWKQNCKGEKEYAGGKTDWNEVALIAKNCSHFYLDDEDELVAEEPVSCYNCRYRRWSPKSFSCKRTVRMTSGEYSKCEGEG